jgi:hypothetical protein
MSKLLMLAGAMAGGGAPKDEMVSAYVVLSEGAKSRLFKISGTVGAPRVDELDAATTLDLQRFRDETQKDLAGKGQLRPADGTWACETVRAFLRVDLGV